MLNQLLQLSVAGVAQGCVYALVALGFVLIYKATEKVVLRPVLGQPAFTVVMITIDRAEADHRHVHQSGRPSWTTSPSERGRVGCFMRAV